MDRVHQRHPRRRLDLGRRVGARDERVLLPVHHARHLGHVEDLVGRAALPEDALVPPQHQAASELDALVLVACEDALAVRLLTAEVVVIEVAVRHDAKACTHRFTEIKIGLLLVVLLSHSALWVLFVAAKKQRVTISHKSLRRWNTGDGKLER